MAYALLAVFGLGLVAVAVDVAFSGPWFVGTVVDATGAPLPGAFVVYEYRYPNLLHGSHSDGLAVPVIGLGIATQYLSAPDALLIFVAIMTFEASYTLLTRLAFFGGT